MRIKPIKGCENYKISDTGIVFNKKNRRLRHYVGRKGYFCIKLWRYGKRRTLYIHSLVLEAFVSPRPPGKQCNHKNGIKIDNRVLNLEWVTQSENMKHAYENGLINIKLGEESINSKLKHGEVWLIKKILHSGVTTQNFISKMFKVSRYSINDINSGKFWSQVIYKSHQIFNVKGKPCFTNAENGISRKEWPVQSSDISTKELCRDRF